MKTHLERPEANVPALDGNTSVTTGHTHRRQLRALELSLHVAERPIREVFFLYSLNLWWIYRAHKSDVLFVLARGMWRRMQIIP